jgi:hypothetical protein
LASLFELDVLTFSCQYQTISKGFHIHVEFIAERSNIPISVFQDYIIVSDKSARFCYGHFIKPFFGDNSKYWATFITNFFHGNTEKAHNVIHYMFHRLRPTQPAKILCERDEYMQYKFKKAIF